MERASFARRRRTVLAMAAFNLFCARAAAVMLATLAIILMVVSQ